MAIWRLVEESAKVELENAGRLCKFISLGADLYVVIPNETSGAVC